MLFISIPVLKFFKAIKKPLKGPFKMIQITSYAQSAKLIFPSFLRVSPTFSRSSKVETSIVRSNAQGIVGDFVKVTTNSPKSTSNPLRVLEIFENLTPPHLKILPRSRSSLRDFLNFIVSP